MRIFAQKPKASQHTTSGKSTKLGSEHFGRSREMSPVLHLQHRTGNQAVLRLLGGNTVPGFAQDFSRIPATAAAYGHVQPSPEVNALGDIHEQEANRNADEILLGAEGDLTNPRFKGDPELEACYDHQRLFRHGSRGTAVAKIQSGMIDYFIAKGEEDPLPVYGADGEFGSETRRAVVKFQGSVGFTGEEVDGVIGHNTMDRMDKEIPTDSPPDVDPDKPKDPDEACLGCKPIAKITKKDKTTTTVFGLCSDNFDVFNTGAGTAQPGPGCLPLASNTRGVVNFRTGTASGPAWQTTAKIRDCTIPPPTATSTTPWEIGFIQTLESSTFAASYDNNNFISVSNKNGTHPLIL
jgi:peptidoglycan hydrolase-like protein with peptidoglycan-binding domain